LDYEKCGPLFFIREGIVGYSNRINYFPTKALRHLDQSIVFFVA
jgi:hypothetical protein